jgi:CubicO group peptidase (beta-lactamase class C family)
MPQIITQIPHKMRSKRCLALVLSLFFSTLLPTLLSAQPLEQSPGLLFDQLQKQASELPRLHSLLVSQRGEMLFEAYFSGKTASQPANMKSASKSVLSALVGIAIDKGYIAGVDQPIAHFFPEYLSGEYADRLRSITVGNLLTMQAGLASTSGRNYGRWVASSDWVEFALSVPMVAQPGTDMIYSTGSTHLLSAIIERASGASTREFAQQHLASPLDFRLAYWSRDPNGVYFGGNDMEITPRQMLRFGQLYLDEGRYGDTQVLSAKWARDSLVARAVSPRGQGRYYGYGWWLRDMAGLQIPLAWGYGGQLIFVVRELDLVVVVTSDSTPGSDRMGHLRRIYEMVENHVITPLLEAPTTSALGIFANSC